MHSFTIQSSLKVKPVILIGCAANWYLNHTGRGFANRNSLSGFWTSTGTPDGIARSLHRRAWPYHALKLPTYYLPFRYFEEMTRWSFLPAFDKWVRHQSLPRACNVVMGPMGSCTPLFDLAERRGKHVLKIFDAPNSHPVDHYGLWQAECDRFSPGYRVPMPTRVVRRISAEIARADFILCPSAFVRDSMVRNGVSEEKCIILPFGADRSLFRPRIKPPEKPLFACVGSMTLRKGLQYLVPAFLRLRRRHPDATLVCAGSVHTDMAQLWPSLATNIQYHPHLSTSRLEELYHLASALVLPSVEEGFARVLSEAMACGTPIVATHESGASTIVKDGIHGFIVPARNEQALEAAMSDIISDPEAAFRMGLAAAQVGGYDWQEYADRLLAEIAKRLSQAIGNQNGTRHAATP